MQLLKIVDNSVHSTHCDRKLVTRVTVFLPRSEANICPVVQIYHEVLCHSTLFSVPYDVINHEFIGTFMRIYRGRIYF